MLRHCFASCRSRSPQRVLALGALAAALVAGGAGAWAQEAPPAADSQAAQAPVKRIVLFTSGVGYFERRGQVEGDATIELKFAVDDVNDLLKSMVLEDLDGGSISTVTYGSRDPITRTLQTFAIDLTETPTLGQLLAQIRGQRVEIDSPTKVAGTIVGVEKQRQVVKEAGVIETELLTLLTDDGLRRVPLESVGSIRIADAALDEEFRQALAVLASGHASDKKAVTLKFLGDGERRVRIGYIQEAPVWKTSYRLVLDDQEKPFLQGWAIAENTTDADWNDVQLSLVSGRPISFVMDLYSPLYSERPVVTPELYASLRPQMYEQNLAREERMAKEAVMEQLREASAGVPASAPAEPMIRSRSVAANGAAGDRGGWAVLGGGAGLGGGAAGEAADADYAGVNLQQGVQSAAQGAEVGELFKYDIANPVTIARQTSAMLPILNDTVEGSKVSIYNAATHAKHPLDGVRLKNSSDLHLMQGPVTVFDGGVYAGDARLPDLAPGAERLVSYALDLDIEVAASGEVPPQQLVSVKIDRGVLQASYRQRRTRTYTLKNSGDAAKTVLVEHPNEAGWELTAPQEPSEKTRDAYRFAVEAKPDASAELKVEEVQTVSQTLAISDSPDDYLLAYINAAEASDAVKDALRQVVRQRNDLAALTFQQESTARQIAAITEEQDRLRQNMQAIDRNTDLYTRYVEKLSEQEDQIERLRQELADVEAKIAAARQALNEYLSGLTLE